jgi:hypothetical protein
MKKKHGIYYGCRPLPGGKFGIVVAIYDRGSWIETDLNEAPYPSAEIAVRYAKGNAEAIENNPREGADYKGFPIIAAADSRLAFAADLVAMEG